MLVTVDGVIPEWQLTDRLRRAREYAGLDQVELSERLGMNKNTVSNYERGFTRPRRSQLLAWALATGVSLSWLENGDRPRLEDGGDETCAIRDSNPEPADYGAANHREARLGVAA